MSIVIDIVGGLFIGGFLMVMALTATNNATTEFFNYNSDAIVQQNLARISQVIQYDLRKMGFGIPENQSHTILDIAQANRLRFLSHLNSDPDCKVNIPAVTTIDNFVDSIEYRILPYDSVDYGDTVIVTYEVSRHIYVSPSYQQTMTVGIIGNPLAFRYLDQVGQPVGSITMTRMVEVTLTAYDPRIVVSTDWVDSRLNDISNAAYRKQELRRLLRASYWRQTRLISKNLKR
ncbi:MAG: hypothetical protein EH225_10130 [Calditrichaeota bacterium]|nr:hypothetical protein [Calditrichota bacterium]RQW00790.1 MAG: hypothetical protein EH225_10130 [Calditrichota bacterium]